MTRKLALAALAAFTLGVASLGFGARTASAEVTMNDRLQVAFKFDNPCEPGLNLISVTGSVHVLWYTTPDNATVMRFAAHYSGTDSDGTRYIVNATRSMKHEIWPTYAPFSDSIIVRLISKGGDDNARIEIVLDYSPVFVPPPNPPYIPPPAAPYVMSVTCQG
jgi:hypothetical protein